MAKQKEVKDKVVAKEVKEEVKEAVNAIGEKIVDPAQFDKKGK